MLHGIRSRMQTQTSGNLDCSLQEILWECLQFTSQQSRKAKKMQVYLHQSYKGQGSEQHFSDLMLFPCVSLDLMLFPCVSLDLMFPCVSLDLMLFPCVSLRSQTPTSDFQLLDTEVAQGHCLMRVHNSNGRSGQRFHQFRLQ